MRILIGNIVVILALVSYMPAASALPAKSTMNLNSKLNCAYIATSGGRAYLQITLKTVGFEKPSRDRRPMNLSVVLDRSGSMSDQRKMEYAKAAVSRLIDELNSEDIFSMVVYDDEVDVIHSAQRVGNSKRRLRQLVSDIYPRNSTNLGGGMLEGLRQVERNIGREYVNRVILLSDGLANQGITNPVELNRIARRHREKSISLTTMGVGLDYNENLMMSLAESGGGNYYFIERPAQLASIMKREFDAASSIIAQNVFIELQLGKGVRLLDVIGCEWVDDRSIYRIPLGDVYSDDSREVTVELDIPEGSGTLTVVKGGIRYQSSHITDRPTFSSSVTYTRDMVLIDKYRDLDVQAKADVAVSTRLVEQAMKALDEGNREEAQVRLQSAREFLSSSPATVAGGASAETVREQSLRLDTYQESLRDNDADTRRAKKAIQYENYRVQKKK